MDKKVSVRRTHWLSHSSFPCWIKKGRPITGAAVRFSVTAVAGTVVAYHRHHRCQRPSQKYADAVATPSGTNTVTATVEGSNP